MSKFAFAVPTFKLLLAAVTIPWDGGQGAVAKAFADLIENATKLDQLIRDNGLLDLATILTDTGNQAVDAYTRSRAATPAQIAGARALFDQCAPHAIPTPDQFAALGLNQAKTLAHMETVARQNRDFARDDLAQSLFREVLTPVLAKLLNDPAFTAKIEPALLRHAFVKLDVIEDNTTELLRLYHEKHQAEQTTVHQDTIFAIARKIRPRVETLKQALIELESAVDKAAELEAAGEGGSNVDGFVDAVLSRLRTLTRQGALDDAVAEANRAIADCDARIDREQAGLAAVLRAAITQHELAFDAAGAAEKIVRLTLLETSDPAQQFERLRSVQNEYYVRGSDRGQNFDLEISIHLARRCLAVANTPAQRGFALTDRGVFLRTLGAREANSDRLQQAAQAFRDALLEHTRDLVPLDWASTQDNLGSALALLGERESGCEGLDQAVQAFRSALLERTRIRVPLDWATTQNNIGNALRALGEREGSIDRLEQSVLAYRDALFERTRDKVPLDWAATQNNLGNVLQTLGAREGNTDRLEQAVQAYRDALLERTRDLVPLDWAMTQNNLGTALATLGAREGSPERLEQAVQAYRDALLEWTRDRVPLAWATTQNNLGIALRTLGARERDPERLELAVRAYRDALLEWTRDRVPLDWATAQNNLGNALQALGERETGTERLEQAVQAYRDALLEWTRDRVPLNWAMTQNNLGNALATLGEREGRADRLEQAVQAHRDALLERTRDRVPLEWAMSHGNQGKALLPLAELRQDAAMASTALRQLTEAEAGMRAGGHIHFAENYARSIPLAQALVDRLTSTP